MAYAKACYRTLGIAYADFSEEEWAELKEQHNGLVEIEDRRKIDNNLIMVAMFGIEDPLRPGIKQAVMDHARAGVRTIMVTGDNIDTAKAIAY
jgi:Ca2+-transporting ATPase